MLYKHTGFSFNKRTVIIHEHMYHVHPPPLSYYIKVSVNLLYNIGVLWFSVFFVFFFDVSVSVKFRHTCAHIVLVSVWVAEWPPFEK